MHRRIELLSRRLICPVVMGLALIGLAVGALGEQNSNSGLASGTIAQGAGTTIIQGGTGSAGGFVPVLTTIAFHADKSGGTVTGDFECLARAPAAATGAASAQFTVNAMYVTGEITGAVVNGDTATLTGTANITGLGAGSAVPFELVVRKGGPGSTAVLTTKGSPVLVFHEILLEGSFTVSSGDAKD
jgi:hypothetical protein